MSNLTFSQTAERKIDSLIKISVSKLKTEGIKELFYIKKYCIGEDRKIDPNKPTECTTNEVYIEVYIFWKITNQKWIQKIDNCGIFKPIKMNNSECFDFFIEQNQKLSKETVTKYMTQENKDNNEYLSVVHSCFRFFKFYTKSNTFSKTIDLFDLSSNLDDENLNYESNKRLKLIRLNTLCNESILEIENSGLLERKE